jgi:hypothetical protein
VTATSGTISKTVQVEGTIVGITLKDAAGQISGTYPYSGTPIVFTLTATTDPAASVNPVWASNADHVAVAPANDGMSATVTVSGMGDAAITATVDGITATYNIATTSALDDAKGYWTFEDPSNYGKATRGTDLKIIGDGAIIPAEGPSADKAAITKTNLTDGFSWDPHGISGQGLTDFTMLFDAWAPLEPERRYYTLWWNFEANNYSFCIRPKDKKMMFNRVGSSMGEYTPEITSGEEPWLRAVFVYAAVPGEPDKRSLRIYGDGKLLHEDLASDVTREMDLYADRPIYFLTGNPDGSAIDDYNPFKLSTLAVWDRALTPEEVASLGGVSK